MRLSGGFFVRNCKGCTDARTDYENGKVKVCLMLNKAIIPEDIFVSGVLPECPLERYESPAGSIEPGKL